MEEEAYLGKYILKEQLGRGGFGTIYRALDPVLQIERAVKVLHPAFNSDPAFIERFRQEARIAARIDHPNIVPVVELGQSDGAFFLVMHLMPGGSLQDLLEKNGPLPRDRALEILSQVAEGLDFAHNLPEKLVHRDIKPANILFDSKGAARISDFGFAKALEGASSATLSATGSVFGSPSYMAPEAWRGGDIGPSADLYSLACMFYELVTGTVLFTGDSPPQIMTRHVLDGPVFPPNWLPDAPEQVESVLRKGLSAAPGARFDSAKAFFTAVSGAFQPRERSLPEPRPGAGTPAMTRPAVADRPLSIERQQQTETAAENRSAETINRQSRILWRNRAAAAGGLIILLLFATPLFGDPLGLYRAPETAVPNPAPSPTFTVSPVETDGIADIRSATETAAAAQRATEAAVIIERAETAKADPLVYGPAEGAIPSHPADSLVDSWLVPVDMSDFVVSVTLTNPYDPGLAAWSIGILFRSHDDASYRVYIKDSGVWTLQYWDRNGLNEVQNGSAGNLSVNAGETNTIEIIALGRKGLFFLNGAFVAALDLGADVQSGGMRIGTGLEEGDGLEGFSTDFSNLNVWRLAPVFGPTSGSLSHEADETIELFGTVPALGNVIVEATFSTSNGPTRGSFTGGFIVRTSGGNQVRVYTISSIKAWMVSRLTGGEWVNLAYEFLPEQTGFDPEGANRLLFVAKENTGVLFVNDIFAGAVDLSGAVSEGEVALGIGFADDETDGFTTEFRDYVVYELP